MEGNEITCFDDQRRSYVLSFAFILLEQPE